MVVNVLPTTLIHFLFAIALLVILVRSLDYPLNIDNLILIFLGYTCDSPFQATTILVNSITTTITKVTTRTNTASTTTKATTTKSNTSTITVKTSSSGKMV